MTDDYTTTTTTLWHLREDRPLRFWASSSAKAVYVQVDQRLSIAVPADGPDTLRRLASQLEAAADLLFDAEPRRDRP